MDRKTREGARAEGKAEQANGWRLQICMWGQNRLREVPTCTPQLAKKPQTAKHSNAHFPRTHLTLGLHPPTANHA